MGKFASSKFKVKLWKIEIFFLSSLKTKSSLQSGLYLRDNSFPPGQETKNIQYYGLDNNLASTTLHLLWVLIQIKLIWLLPVVALPRQLPDTDNLYNTFYKT